MTYRRSMLGLSTVVSTACALLVAFPAWPFLFESSVTVVEFRHAGLNHYFLTANRAEMAAIDAGAAGAGWLRTGFAFVAMPPVPTPGALTCTDCVPVIRFHGTPGLGPNSHFYTADRAEAEGLNRAGTGWTLEGVAFRAHVPDALGQCPSWGVPVPVFRLYNNRWMFNDSNHRYVTSTAERAAMVAEGWIDERVRLCVSGVVEEPIKTIEVNISLADRILPSSECENEATNLGGCMAINNLPVPNKALGPYTTYPERELFRRSTGVASEFVYAPFSESPNAASQNMFVQGGPNNSGMDSWGIHIDTRWRGASRYSSVNPLFQFSTNATPGTPDARFFPWVQNYPFETQLAIAANFSVTRLNTWNSESHAYGHPTIEFIDQRSGHHLYFTVLAYGTINIEGDYLAPDVGSGKVIVGTTFRDGSPYGRNFGTRTVFTPSGLNTYANGTFANGALEFRIDRAEFQRIVDAARGVDTALSGNPADYLIDNFHFTNEVVGDGEIGLNISAFQLRVMRR